MVVTASYDNSTTSDVTGYTFSPNGALTMSDTAITVSYTEDSVTKTATQAITVAMKMYTQDELEAMTIAEIQAIVALVQAKALCLQKSIPAFTEDAAAGPEFQALSLRSCLRPIFQGSLIFQPFLFPAVHISAASFRRGGSVGNQKLRHNLSLDAPQGNRIVFFQAVAFPPFLQQIIACGGLVNYLKQNN